MLKTIFRSLKHRNYRLFFTGQSISLMGTWMQQTAMSWLVYRLTQSALMLGVVGFLTQSPSLFLTPFAGVFADRISRRHIFLTTQILAMIQAFILAALVLSHAVEVWHILTLSLFLGIVNAVDIPTRQSFAVDIIENREDLGNTIALNSSMFNSARLLGPAVAGLVIAEFGEGWCFLINAFSYLAVIYVLLAMKIKPAHLKAKHPHPWQELKEGFHYAYGFTPIRSLLLLVASISLLGVSYAVLLPVFAKEILRGGPRTLGFLMSSTGLGALSGALYLASRKNVRGLIRVIWRAALLFSAALIVFSRSHSLEFSLPLLFVTGFSVIVLMASCNTVLQTIVDDDKRGRVMSFYTLSFMGMAPFGSLLAGSLAGKIGAPNTLALGGFFCLGIAFVFSRALPSLRKMLRPIYVKKGIIVEVASGIQSATDLTSLPKE